MNQYECEVKERIVVKELYELMSKNKNAKYYTTPILGVDSYDGCITIFNDEFRVLKRYVIEVKLRSSHYDELIYEPDKHNALTKIANEIDATILYVNITPSGCYVFLINDELLRNKQSLKRNKSQCFNTGNLTKSTQVFMLNIQKAKRINNLDINHINALFLVDQNEVNKKNNSDIMNKQLFKDVENIEDLFKRK